RQTTVVLYYNIDLVLRGKLTETAETINSGGGHLLRTPFAVGIHANGMAPEKASCLHPFIMVPDCFMPGFLIYMSQTAFAVYHNQNVGDTVIFCAFVQFPQ